jgi:hypothetical protein
VSDALSVCGGQFGQDRYGIAGYRDSFRGVHLPGEVGKGAQFGNLGHDREGCTVIVGVTLQQSDEGRRDDAFCLAEVEAGASD